MNYKGFDKDLKCRDFQYEIGKEYEEKKARSCETGFHACEYPLDVFGYYPPATSRFCEVEQSGDIDKDSNGTKIASTKIKIGAEIGIIGIVKASVEYIKSKVDWDNAKESSTANQSVATNTDKQSAATNTGNQSAATNTGDYSASTNTGDYSVATNTGNQSVATNTGNQSVVTVEGKDSVAIVTGKNSGAKGAIGCWLVLTERGKWNGKTSPILGMQAVKVDGEQIEANTFYTLEGGVVVKAKQRKKEN